MRQIFLDTETTGLYADQGDRIVEVGCVEMVSRRLTGRHLHHYVNPQRASHEEALKVHGLTEVFLSDKPLFSAIAAEFAEFVRGADIVIHNASFDVGFINAELRRIGHPPLAELAGKITDSLLMAREQYPGKANSLDALCRRLEVDNAHRTLHGALMDASLLAEVYIRMTRGQNALVIDSNPNPTRQQDNHALPDIDLSRFSLPVLIASDVEANAHESLLKELDKASGGKTVWRHTLVGTAT